MRIISGCIYHQSLESTKYDNVKWSSALRPRHCNITSYKREAHYSVVADAGDNFEKRWNYYLRKNIALDNGVKSSTTWSHGNRPFWTASLQSTLIAHSHTCSNTWERAWVYLGIWLSVVFGYIAQPNRFSGNIRAHFCMCQHDPTFCLANALALLQMA